MIDFILTSETPIEVIFQNTNFRVSKFDQKIIKLAEEKSFSLNYIFANKSGLNNLLVNCVDGEFFTDNNNVKLIKYSTTKYKIEILKNNNKFSYKKIKKINNNDCIYNFYENGVVEIETNEHVKFSNMYNLCITDAEVVNLNNNFVGLKLFENENSTCIILNPEFYEVFRFENSILETTENGFKILKILNDVAQHGIVIEYDISEEINIADEYSVYLKNKPINDFNTAVLPMYFLQCIKAKDYKEAKTCLVEDLKQKVSIKHLENFFGNFIEIDYVDKKENQYECGLLYQEKNNFFVKNYLILIKNDKILNINSIK